jgi:hypothetical protein
MSLEGIVSKCADAPYAPGNRGLWLKVKCLLDWTLVEKHAHVHRFFKELIALRKNRDLGSGGLTCPSTSCCSGSRSGGTASN